MSKTRNYFSFLILFHSMQSIKFIHNLCLHNIIVAHIIIDNNQKMSLQILFMYKFLQNSIIHLIQQITKLCLTEQLCDRFRIKHLNEYLKESIFNYMKK